jgi:hypothetical protein
MSEIITRLKEIQTTLKAPKGQTNTFGKYKYRSCEDILEALKPRLFAQECALTITDSMQMVGDRFYVKATATLHHGEDSISVDGFAREAENKKGMDAAQVTGAASSYARKYALNGLFSIDDTKDADHSNTHGQQPQQKKMPPTKQKWPGLNTSPQNDRQKGMAAIEEKAAELKITKYELKQALLLCARKTHALESAADLGVSELRDFYRDLSEDSSYIVENAINSRTAGK